MVYDRGRSHSSPGYSPRRSYSAPETEQEKAERQHQEQQQQQQRQLEQTAIKSSLLLPDLAEKLVIQGAATEQQVWFEFLQEVGRQFDTEVAMIVAATVSDGVLPIGDLVAAGITLAIAVEIYSKWDSLWQEAASGIVTTQESENQIYATPSDSEVETQRHTGHQPVEVETGTPGFDTESGIKIPEHTGHDRAMQPDARDFVMESNVSWKPSMNLSEAEAYTKDSHYADKTFYHGTDTKSSQSISESGVDPAFFNKLSNYGPGFYTANNNSTAREYAELTAEETGEQQALLGVRLNASNPVVFNSGTDFLVQSEKYVRETGRIGVDEPALEYSQYLRGQGYDAIEIKALGYVVVFETQQVVVVEKEMID